MAPVATEFEKIINTGTLFLPAAARAHSLSRNGKSPSRHDTTRLSFALRQNKNANQLF
jgi:hypothetical protein